MLSGLAAAGVSALGGIVSNAMNAGYNAREAQKNRDFQREMYERQYKDSIDFWNLQQEYNSPQNQLIRLRNAGLNPLLMYGQSGVQNVATSQPNQPSQPSGSQASASFTNPFQTAEYLLLDAERRKKEAETKKISSETDWQNLENKFQNESYEMRMALLHNEFDRVKAIIADTWDTIFQRGMMNAQQAATLAQARQYEVKRFNLDEYQVTKSLEMGWYDAMTGRINASANVRNAATNWYNAVTNRMLSNWQVRGIAQDIWYKSLEQPYKLKNMGLQNLLNKYDVRIKAQTLLRNINENTMYNFTGGYQMPTWAVPMFMLSGKLSGRIPDNSPKDRRPMPNSDYRGYYEAGQ